jgi:hypothetical protein
VRLFKMQWNSSLRGCYTFCLFACTKRNCLEICCRNIKYILIIFTRRAVMRTREFILFGLNPFYRRNHFGKEHLFTSCSKLSKLYKFRWNIIFSKQWFDIYIYLKRQGYLFLTNRNFASAPYRLTGINPNFIDFSTSQ